LGESDLTALGVDPSTARRQFRAHCGMTFAAYQRSRRMGAALREVRQEGSVTFAQVGAGFRIEQRLFGGRSRTSSAPRPAGRMTGIADRRLAPDAAGRDGSRSRSDGGDRAV